MRSTALLCLGLCTALMTGCAKTSSIQLAANVAQITVEAPPACGTPGAQKVAFEEAAATTLRLGYDSFLVAGQAEDRHSVGSQSVAAGNSDAVVKSSMSLKFLRYGQTFQILMFRFGDDSENAIDARRVLGPDWEEMMKPSFRRTC